MKTTLQVAGLCLLALLGAAPAGAAPGDVDMRFGSGGEVPRPYGDSTAVARMPDGRLLVYDSNALAGGQLQLRMRMLDASGQLLASWGTGGVSAITLDFDPYRTVNWSSAGFHAAGGQDGAVTGVVNLFGPSGSSPSGPFTRMSRVVRIAADGRYDASFAAAAPSNLINDQLRDHVFSTPPWMQTDGSTVISLGCSNCDVYPLPSAVLRLLPSGIADVRFNLEQQAIPAQFSSTRTARRLADGRLVVVGDMGVVRFQADGRLDTSFGTSGVVLVTNDALESIVARALDAFVLNDGLSIQDAAVSPDGRVVLAMRANVSDSLGGSMPRVLLMGLDASGNPDPGFGGASTGIATVNWSNSPFANTIILEYEILLARSPAGSLTATVGFEAGRHWHNAFWRLDPSGRALSGPGLPGWQLAPTWMLGPDQMAERILAGDDAGTVHLLTDRALIRLSADAPAGPGILSSPGYRVWEDSLGPGASTISVPVTRLGGSQGRITVDYATAVAGVANAATPGDDYLPTSGRLEWADGESGTRFISLDVINDTLTERSAERIQISLTGATGGPLLARADTTVWIEASDVSTAPPAPTPSPTPAPTPNPPAAGNAGGGGAMDLLLLMLAGVVVPLVVARRRAATLQAACSCLVLFGATRSLAAPGDWDLRFGVDGEVPLAYGRATGVARMPDGRLLMYDSAPPSSGQVQLRMRMLDEAGRAVTSWGTRGEASVTVDLNPSQPVNSSMASFSATGGADGTITGIVNFWSGAAPGSGERISRAVRITPDGQLDTAFAAATPANLLNDQSRDLVWGPPTVQPDGSTLVSFHCDYCDVYPVWDAVVRLRPDGSFDRRVSLFGMSTDSNFLLNVQQLEGGGFLVVGDRAVMRFRPDGTPGEVLYSSTWEWAVGRALHANVFPDGLRILAGEMTDGDQVVLVMNARVYGEREGRETISFLLKTGPDGSLDAGFGGTGTGIAAIDLSAVPGLDEAIEVQGARLARGESGRLCVLLHEFFQATDYQRAILLRSDATGRRLTGGSGPAMQVIPMWSDHVLLEPDAGTTYAATATSLIRFSLDAPPSPGLLLSPGVQANEDSLGATEAVMIPVSRVAGSSGRISVEYATVAAGTTAALGEDFAPTAGRLEWADGETGTRLIPLRVINDLLEERAPETVAIALTPTARGPLMLPATTLVIIGASDIKPAPPAPTPTPAPSPAPARNPSPGSLATGTAGGGGAIGPVGLLLSSLLLPLVAARRRRGACRPGRPLRAKSRKAPGASLPAGFCQRWVPAATLLAGALLTACGGADDAASPGGSGTPAPVASAPPCTMPPVGQAGGGLVPSGNGGLIVTTSAGPVEGMIEEGVRAFKGVRFAAPPTGCLRFRAPAEPVPVPAVTPAQTAAASCSQIFNGNVLGQEDCLHLNLWTPQDNAVHPVLVVLHGGPINSGNAARLAAQTGLVIVAPNRRIGVFATLALQQLADERTDGATGTYGVQDTVAALRWVQRNIVAFGGDPARVMVVGLSAGGSVACSLFATPSARGLFSAAAVFSGVCRPRLVVDASLARYSTAPPLKGVHSALITESGCGAVSNPLDCLRNLSVNDMLQAAAKLPTLPAGGPAFPVAPVIDGVIVTSDPYSALESQMAGGFPVMAGSTRDEMRSQVTLATMDDAAYRTFLGTFNAGAVDALYALYPPSQYGTPTDAAYAFLTEVVFGCTAEALVRAASSNRPAHLFLVTGGITTNGYVVHGVETPFLFDTLEQRGITVDQAAIDLRSALQSVVKSMATSPSLLPWVDAGSSGTFSWPAWSAGAVRVLEFGAPVVVSASHRSGRCVTLGTLLPP